MLFSAFHCICTLHTCLYRLCCLLFVVLIAKWDRKPETHLSFLVQPKDFDKLDSPDRYLTSLQYAPSTVGKTVILLELVTVSK